MGNVSYKQRKVHWNDWLSLFKKKGRIYSRSRLQFRQRLLENRINVCDSFQRQAPSGKMEGSGTSEGGSP